MVPLSPWTNLLMRCHPSRLFRNVFTSFLVITVVGVFYLSATADAYLYECGQPSCSVREEKTPDTAIPRIAQGKKLTVVNYYATWCPHCVHFAPEYTKIAKHYKDSGQAVDFVAVDCEKYGGWCSSIGIQGFPTLRLYNKRPAETKKEGSDWPKGGHGYAAVTHYLDELLKQREDGTVPDSPSANDDENHKDHSHEEENTSKAILPADTPADNLPAPNWRFPEEQYTYADREYDALVGILQTMKTGVFLKSQKDGTLPEEGWRSLVDWLSLLSDLFPKGDARTGLKLLISEAARKVDPKKTKFEDWNTVLRAWSKKLAPDSQLASIATKTLNSGSPEVLASLKTVKSYTGSLWDLFHILTVEVDRRAAWLQKQDALANSEKRSEQSDIRHEAGHSGSAVSGTDMNRKNTDGKHNDPYNDGTSGSEVGMKPVTGVLQEYVNTHSVDSNYRDALSLRKAFYHGLKDFVVNFFGCDTCKYHFLEQFDACLYSRCDNTHPTKLWLWELHNAVTQRVARQLLVQAAKDGHDSNQQGAAPGAEHKPVYIQVTDVAPLKSNGETSPGSNDEFHSLSPELLYPTRSDCPLCYKSIDERSVKPGLEGVWAILDKGMIRAKDEKQLGNKEVSLHSRKEGGAVVSNGLHPKDSVLYSIFDRSELEQYLVRTFSSNSEMLSDAEMFRRYSVAKTETALTERPIGTLPDAYAIPSFVYAGLLLLLFLAMWRWRRKITRKAFGKETNYKEVTKEIDLHEPVGARALNARPTSAGSNTEHYDDVL